MIFQDRSGIAIASFDGLRVTLGGVASKGESRALPTLSRNVAKNLTLKSRCSTKSELVQKAKQ
jgi:hypothetical protein